MTLFRLFYINKKMTYYNFVFNNLEIRVLGHKWGNNRIVLSDFIEAFTGQSSDLFVEYIHAPETVTIDEAIGVLYCLPQHKYNVSEKSIHKIYKKYQLFEYGLYGDHI